MVEIQEARDLPDTDNFLFNIKRCFGQEKDVTDPYVAVFLDHTRIITTSVIYNNLCPQWNEFFRVSVCHHAKRLVFRIKDQDELGTDNVGEVCVMVSDLLQMPGMRLHGWQDIIDGDGRHQGQLFVKLIYKPYKERAKNQFECNDCYFPLRSGNAVTLYSCARNTDIQQSLPVDPDLPHLLTNYMPSSLWIDLYKSLVASQKFIYITGWSVFAKIKLLRGDDWTLLKTQEELDLASLTLGELLKLKAEAGIRVLVMIWGETTSIMGTHDTETENYFKGQREKNFFWCWRPKENLSTPLGTGVFVARVARQTKTKEYKDLDAHFTANLGYSHHQKAVILDAPHPNPVAESRRIVAYVGGIDLTGGNWCFIK